MSTSKLRDSLTKIMDGFKELGFNAVLDNHELSHGFLSVYLHHKKNPKATLMDSDLWLRIKITHSMELGTRASVDFKAGPDFWLCIEHEIED